MIIIVAPEKNKHNESSLINQLFDKGLNLFHIRKYTFDDPSMLAYIECIEPAYRKKLVLHSHYHLAEKMGIIRLHINEVWREREKYLPYLSQYTLSTSVHSIEVYNKLSAIWDYAFFSPVYPSISKKGYGLKDHKLVDIRKKSNSSVKLIGLGGVDENNFRQLREAGAEGAALVGAIWQNQNPLKSFIRCRKIDLLY